MRNNLSSVRSLIIRKKTFLGLMVMLFMSVTLVNALSYEWGTSPTINWNVTGASSCTASTDYPSASDGIYAKWVNTDNYGSGTGRYPGSGSMSFNAITAPPNNPNNPNDVYHFTCTDGISGVSDTDTIRVTCNAPKTWNSSACIDPNPTGTFTWTSIPSCVINEDASTCQTTLGWTSSGSNPVYLTDSSNGPYNAYGTGAQTGTVTVPYNVGYYRVHSGSYTGPNLNVSDAAPTASCVSNTVWNGSKCKCAAGSSWSAGNNACIVSGCPAGTNKSWGGACSGQTESKYDGDTYTVVNTAPGYTGSAVYQCSGTNWATNPNAGSSCSPIPAGSCSNQVVSWPGGPTWHCAAETGITANGQTVNLSNDSNWSTGMTGTASVTCNANTNTYTPVGGTTCDPINCSPGYYYNGTSCGPSPAGYYSDGINPPVQCDPNYYCPQGTTPPGGTNPPRSCPPGTVSPSGSSSSGQCVPPGASGCASQMMTWGSCAGTIAATSNGGSNSVSNIQGGYTGSATFSCSNANYSYVSGSCTQSGTCANGASNAPTCNYCPTFQYYENGTCNSCPANSWAPAGSVGSGSCTCQSGYMPSGGACVPNGSWGVVADDIASVYPSQPATVQTHVYNSEVVGGSAFCKFEDYNSTLLYNWTSLGWVNMWSSPNKGYDITTPATPGSYLYTVTCSDGNGLFFSDNATVTVVPFPSCQVNEYIAGNTCTPCPVHGSSPGGTVYSCDCNPAQYTWNGNSCTNGSGIVVDAGPDINATPGSNFSVTYTVTTSPWMRTNCGFWTGSMNVIQDTNFGNGTGVDGGTMQYFDPAPMTPGAYPYTVRCQDNWDSNIYDEDTIMVNIGSPDLTAGVITPTITTIGSPTTFTSTITNQGTGSTGGSFNNFIQVASAINGGGTITDLPSSSMGTLTAGSNLTTSNSQGYTFIATGNYSVRACADKSSSGDSGVIDEGSMENNNCGPWTTVTVSPAVLGVDLVPLAVYASPNPSPTAGVVGNLAVSIKNLGNSATGAPFPNHIKIASGPGGTGTITEADYIWAPAMTAGETQVLLRPYTFSGSGTWSLQGCVDRPTGALGGNISEVDETNNCGGWTDITVITSGEPAFTINVSPNTYNTVPGSSQAVTFESTRNDITCRFLDNVGTPLTTYTASTMNAGGIGYTASKTLIDSLIPDAASTYGYTLQCRSDTDSSNTAQSAFTITSTSGACPTGQSFDTIGNSCVGPDVVSVVPRGVYYYSGPLEGITLTCTDSLSYKVYKTDPVLTLISSGAYSGPKFVPLVTSGNYGVVCVHGSVESPMTTVYYNSPPPPAVKISIDTYPKTIKAGAESTLNWTVQYPVAACTLSANAVCTGGVCNAAQIAANAALNTIINASSTDANDPNGSRRITTAIKTIAPGHESTDYKALGKKTFKFTNTTDFVINCGAGKTATARVRVANSNEQ